MLELVLYSATAWFKVNRTNFSGKYNLMGVGRVNRKARVYYKLGYSLNTVRNGNGLLKDKCCIFTFLTLLVGLVNEIFFFF